jgi:choline dehydrogenase-like flavoprotein
MTDNRYDVIIIGTGAGGGTLAYHLAPSGKRILIVERGDYVPREKANWDPQVVNVDAHYNTKEHWLDKDGKELHPHTNYYVGGNTKFYGAALFRLRKEDFGELRHKVASRPRGRSATTTWSRTTRRPKTFTRSTAIAGKIQRNLPPAGRTGIRR